MPFSSKVPSDTEVFSVTAANDGLGVGVTITGSTWNVTIGAGTETVPTLVKVGSPSVTGLIVSQQFTGGTIGITYIVQCTYTTSDGQTITKFDCVLCKAPGC
jgi:hypothetical protein